MGPLMKLPVFLLATAITLSDARKSTDASGPDIVSSTAHAGLSVDADDLTPKKNTRNNLVAKLSTTVTGDQAKDLGRAIAGSPTDDDRSET